MNVSRAKLKHASLTDMSIDLSTFNGMVDFCSDDGYPTQRGSFTDQMGQIVRRVPDIDVQRYYSLSGLIPAYAVAVWNNGIIVDGDWLVEYTQTSQYGCQNDFVVNDENPAPGSHVAFGQVGPFYKVLYDPSDGNPAINTRYGPISGQWPVKQGAGGFVSCGVYDSSINVCLMRHEPQFWYFAINSGSAIAVGSSGSMQIYKMMGGAIASMTLSGVSVSVRAVFGNIAAGARCLIQTLGTGMEWYALETDKCP